MDTNRPARFEVYFQGADHPAQVAVINFGRRLGVNRGQFGVKPLRTQRLSFGRQFSPQSPVRRDAGDAPTLDHGPHPLAGPAHQQGQASPGVNIVDGLVGPLLKFGQGEGVIGRDNIDQVMGHGGLFLRRWLGGADIHALVNLPGIGGDDLAKAFLLRGQGLSDGNRQGRFANAGRADNHDQG